MKIVCIADLQGRCNKIKPEMLPPGDMLLVAGDLASWGSLRELEEVNKWLKTLPYRHKVVVGGNHDGDLIAFRGKKIFTNAIYLQDELLEIEGLKIWGSPLSDMNNLVNFRAFCEKEYLKKATALIPEGLDILLTHGPCYGILDTIPWEPAPVGSRDLLDAVKEKKPKYHVFGHIHEQAGQLTKDGTIFINAALCDGQNNIVDKKGALLHKPIVIEI